MIPIAFVQRYCLTLPESALQRFLTDPTLVGVEQIAATDVPSEFLEKPYTECRALDPYSHGLSQVKARIL